MGFSLEMLACPLDQKARFLGNAGVTLEGAVDPFSVRLAAADTPSHFVLLQNLRPYATYREPDYARLSDGVDLAVLTVVDSAGAQELHGMRDGVDTWEVSFLDTNDDFLAVTGPVPVNVDPLIAAEREKFVDPDAPDTDSIAFYGGGVPGEAFRALTGVDYETPHEFEFRDIKGELPRPKPWWRFW